MEKVLINGCLCKRCNHRWNPRTEKVFVCPKCKSPRWNEEEGIIRINRDIDSDDIIQIIVNNPIFAEDLRIIGNVVRS